MTREAPRETHLFPFVAVSVPGEENHRFSEGSWTGREGNPLSGHSSAQPLRTHELHGTALLTEDQRGGFAGIDGFRIYLSHLSLDLTKQKSVDPAAWVREINVPATFRTRQGASAVTHGCSDGTGGERGDASWGLGLRLWVHDEWEGVG